jgi:hypothetical protein
MPHGFRVMDCASTMADTRARLLRRTKTASVLLAPLLPGMRSVKDGIVYRASILKVHLLVVTIVIIDSV